jgi:hypothetical protein
MTELERSLAELARRVEWPATPPLTVGLDVRRRPRRALFVVAGFAALVAVGAALAVPSARSSILRFFSLGGVTIERVSTLPTGQELPLAATLGRPVTYEAAARILGEPPRLPRSQGRLRLYADGSAVSALFASPDPVLLTEFRSGSYPGILKKLVGDSTGVQTARITIEAEGVWISGAEHLYISPVAPPRLAGNVLLWQSGEITYRIEGRGLTEDTALRLAREIQG